MELREVRYAARSLRKSPGFSAAAILTLALGIGANTAVFSVLQGVVLAPLPYQDPDRLVLVLVYNRTLKYPTYHSYPDFLDWKRQSRSLEQIAAYSNQGFDLTNPGAPEHLSGKEVTSGFFSTLGVKLALGREFSAEEDRFGGMPAAILSDRIWRERFASSPQALGRAITLNGADYTVVGVLPSDFRFGNENADAYTALGHDDPFVRNDRTNHDVASIARMRPGVSLGQARAELNAVQAEIDRQNPTTERGLEAYIEPLKHSIVGDVSNTLLLLLGAVALVLLIACANVANLLLARSAGRSREFSVRLALGANRMQVMRQVVTESVLLAMAGGIVGLAVAKLGLKALLLTFGQSLPRLENIGFDGPVLFFALAASIAVGMLFGLLPALKSSSADLQGSLQQGGRGLTGGPYRTQSVLVVRSSGAGVDSLEWCKFAVPHDSQFVGGESRV